MAASRIIATAPKEAISAKSLSQATSAARAGLFFHIAWKLYESSVEYKVFVYRLPQEVDDLVPVNQFNFVGFGKRSSAS